jgi:hypothetical protein
MGLKSFNFNLSEVYRFKFLPIGQVERMAEITSGGGFDVLGIEVTDTALADACQLGNIDPQHGFMRRAPANLKARSAIEAAIYWPLPPIGATLMTVLPDLDSVGAMAILELRAQGYSVTDEIRSRIDVVTRGDCFDFGSWEDWVKYHPPIESRAIAFLHSDLYDTEYLALASAVRELGSKRLSAAVNLLIGWLLTGFVPTEVNAAYLKTQSVIATAWNNGAIHIKCALSDKLCIIQSELPNALNIGYRYAPVVLAEGIVSGRRKLTIAQFSDGYLDFTKLLDLLNRDEPGWGGGKNIIGSPQGKPCQTELDGLIKKISASYSEAGWDYSQASSQM